MYDVFLTFIVENSKNQLDIFRSIADPYFFK